MTGVRFQRNKMIFILTILIASTSSFAADFEDSNGKKPQPMWRASASLSNGNTQWVVTDSAASGKETRSTTGRQIDNTDSNYRRAAEAIKKDFSSHTAQSGKRMSIEDARRFIDSKIANLKREIAREAPNQAALERKARQIERTKDMFEYVRSKLDDATYHQKRYMKEVLYTYRDIRQYLKETYGTYPRALDAIANADSEKWRIKPWLEKIGINESIFSEIEALAERAAYAQKNSFCKKASLLRQRNPFTRVSGVAAVLGACIPGLRGPSNSLLA